MSQEEFQLADWSLAPEILKILEKDFPDSLSSCRYLEFSASCKTGDAILLTPGGKIDKYGTFVTYVHQYNYGTFYSLNPDYKEMKSLLKSKLIPWDKGPIWNRIHEKFQPALDELYEEWNMKQLIPPFIGDAYLMDIDEAKTIAYVCPPEVYLGPLKAEQSELIDSSWPHRDDKSESIAKLMIGKKGGLGLYLKELDELIAWCLIWAHNGPGHLFVTDQHRRKGYGTLLAKAITKSLAEKDIQPMIGIQTDNAASQDLWGKIGYKKFNGIRRTSAKLQ